MLYATVRQRKIHVKNPVTVIRNGINVDWLILDMDDEWQEMDSIVCVFTNGNVAKEMLHTFGQPLLVPWECLAETGLLSVSCTGYVADSKVMTTMLPDSFWNVVQNGPVTGDVPLEPTPTLYEQVLAAAGAANKAATEAVEVKNQLLLDKESGVFDGEDGVTPKVKIGSVVTGSSGSEAQVTATGSAAEVVLNFVLPRGAQGARGTPGAPGPAGEDGVSPTIDLVRGSDVVGNTIVPNYTLTIRNPDGTTQSFTIRDGAPGTDGKPGDYFYPTVSEDGVLSWEMRSVRVDGNGFPYPIVIPADVNIKGADGRGISSISVSAAGVWTVTYTDGTTQEVTPTGAASVTAETIKQALGYTPANAENMVTNPATATAGQGIAVEAVDESGKPTSWKAVDLSNVKSVKTDFVFESGKSVRVLIVEYLDGASEQFGVGSTDTDTILFPTLSEDGVLSWKFYDATGVVPTPADMPLATQEMLSQLSAEIDDVDGRFERVETPGANLLNMETVTHGYVINKGNGSLSASTSYGTTDFIPVKPGQKITYQIGAATAGTNTGFIKWNHLAAFDADKNIIADAGVSWATTEAYEVPDGVAYIRASMTNLEANLTDHKMIVDSEKLVEYEPYTVVVYYRLKPENNNDDHIKKLAEESISERFEAVKSIGKNLLNPEEIELGFYVNNANGTLAANASYGTSGYIPVEPGKTYTFQVAGSSTPNYTQVLGMVFLAAYNTDKACIADAGGRSVTTYTPPEGVAYIRFSTTHFVSATNAVRMFVEAVNPVPYEAYTERINQVLKPEYNNDSHVNKLIENKVGFISNVNAYLPKHLYCAVGRTIELYNNQVCLQADRFHMAWSCSVGKALKRKFSVTGVDAQIGDYTLALRIYNDSREVVWEGNSTLHVVSASIATAHSVCPIGDSLTNQKRWIPEVVNLSGEKISFVGTYTYNGKDATETTRQSKHEGRSGFSAKNYINGDPYTYSGATESPNNVFWDGSRFNWATYKTASGLTPDAVQIFLGTNGLGEDNTENAGYIKQMVDYIRQDDANIPIFVVNTIYRSNQNGIGVQQSTDGYAALSGVWKYNEDRKIMNLMEILDGLLDGYSNLYMVNLALTHDSEYNFGAVETAVNPRAAQTEFMPTESVHPQTQGYFQMADVIFSVYAAAFG